MSFGKLLYTEEFTRNGVHYHRSVFAPLMVRVNDNFAQLGTDVRLMTGKDYPAQHATNQPDWKERGSVFVNGLLLHREDYKIVEWFPKEDCKIIEWKGEGR